MLIFKKIFSQFFFPIPLVTYLFLVALILLWFTKKQKTGKILISFGIVLFLVMSYGGISNILLKNLENRYDRYDVSKLLEDFIKNEKGLTQLIVVLGGGYTPDPEIPVTSQLNYQSLVRLIEGIRLYRSIPGSKLLLSAGNMYGKTSNAEVMAKLAEDIGINEDDIIVESKSNDTQDQAMIIKLIVGGDPFILVTSASHMPRAMALFKKLGTNPIPAPTGYLVKQRQYSTPGMFFPSSEGITRLESAFYEYLGLIWEKLRGQI